MIRVPAAPAFATRSFLAHTTLLEPEELCGCWVCFVLPAASVAPLAR
jgi:hypothetical protein